MSNPSTFGHQESLIVPPDGRFGVRSTIFTALVSGELTIRVWLDGFEAGYRKELNFGRDSVRLTVTPQQKRPGSHFWESPPSDHRQSASRFFPLTDAKWAASRSMNEYGKGSTEVVLWLPKHDNYSVAFQVADYAGVPFKDSEDGGEDFARRVYANPNTVSTC
jgi:hypothetical protein